MSKDKVNKQGPYRIASYDIAQENELIEIVNEASNELGVSPPKRIVIKEDPELDASYIALGFGLNDPKRINPKVGDITITTGFIEKLIPLELKAVVGHELTHRKHTVRDLTTSVSTFALMAGCAYFSSKVIPLPAHAAHDSRAAFGIAETALSYLYARAFLGRRKENEADAGGAQVAGTDAMMGALKHFAPNSSIKGFVESLTAYLLPNDHPPTLQRIARLNARKDSLDNPNPPTQEEQQSDTQQQGTTMHSLLEKVKVLLPPMQGISISDKDNAPPNNSLNERFATMAKKFHLKPPGKQPQER